MRPEGNNAVSEVQKAAPAAKTADIDAPSMPIFASGLVDKSKLGIEPLFADFVDFETFARSDFRAVKVLACEAVPKGTKLLKVTLDYGSGPERMILSGSHAYSGRIQALLIRKRYE